LKVQAALFACIIGTSLSLHAEVCFTHIFGHHRVLQREQANPVWDKAPLAVTIGGQSHSTVTVKDGTWRVKIDPLAVGSPGTSSTT
jgi:sialate O-acetylesterase